MDVGVKILLDFVEGRLSAAAFEKEVYENPDVERVLSNDPTYPRPTMLAGTSISGSSRGTTPTPAIN